MKRKRLFGFASIASPKEVADAILHCTRKTPLEPLASLVHDSDGSYALTLHPAAEPLYMELDGEYVTVSAKTSDAGPGYHAFLVSALDSVQASLGLKWEWNGDDDESDFARDRDFEKLQSEMAKHFKAVCRVIAGQIIAEGGSGMMMSMPLDFGAHVLPNEVLTPLGPRTAEELHTWAALENAELRRAAAIHFPWWEQGFKRDFFRGIALHSMWMEQRWAAPIDDADRSKVKRTLGWCEEARRLAADPPVPPEAVNELEDLLASRGQPIFPKEHGIGYRRRMMHKRLTGYWTLDVPGSLEGGTEDNGTMVVFWNDALTIRASAFSGSPDKVDASQTNPEPGQIEAKRDFSPDSESVGFMLTINARTFSSKGEEKLCLVTVWMANEEHRLLAEKIADTLAYREAGT